jgi:Quercetinase C-terminal cupin domain
VNGKSLRAGDGAAASELPALTVTATVDGSEFLLFDLP